jgi:hypothetical protein
VRRELDDLLCKKYPKIFADRNKSMMETCMCWGFDCGDGWFNIIDRLCANIQHHIDQRVESNERNRKYREMVAAARAGDFTAFNEHFKWCLAKPEALENYRLEVLEDPIPVWREEDPEIPQVVADQVKEKYGTLRFYSHGGDDIIDGMIRMAEAMSAVTCEVCGNPGKTVGGGWVRTLCKTHAEEQNYGWEDEEEKYGDYVPYGHPTTEGDN